MEDDPLIGLLLLQLFFILLNAVFACAEIAVLSVNEVKLNKLAARLSPYFPARALFGYYTDINHTCRLLRQRICRG